MRDVRIRTRELAATMTEQIKTSSATAQDVALIAQEIAGLRRASSEQAAQVAALGASLGPHAEGPLESS
jgi:hypothetical protein